MENNLESNKVEETIVTPLEDVAVVTEKIEEKVEDVVVEKTAIVEETVIQEEVKTKPENTINAPSYPRTNNETQALGNTANGAIGTTKVVKPTPAAAPEKKKAQDEDKVAIHSTKNMTWGGVGKVYRGYNIVTKQASEQWLTRSSIRLATPEEVAKEFGK